MKRILTVFILMMALIGVLNAQFTVETSDEGKATLGYILVGTVVDDDAPLTIEIKNTSGESRYIQNFGFTENFNGEAWGSELIFIGATISNTDFTPGTALANDATVTFNFTYDLESMGTKPAANFYIRSNPGNSFGVIASNQSLFTFTANVVQPYNITAIGMDPVETEEDPGKATAEFNFGKVIMSTTPQEHTFTLTNGMEAQIEVFVELPNNNKFSIKGQSNDYSVTIPAGGTQSFVVEYDIEAEGTHTGDIKFELTKIGTEDVPDKLKYEIILGLSGTVVEGLVRVTYTGTDDTIDFGHWFEAKGTGTGDDLAKPTRQITITNILNDDVVVDIPADDVNYKVALPSGWDSLYEGKILLNNDTHKDIVLTITFDPAPTGDPTRTRVFKIIAEDIFGASNMHANEEHTINFTAEYKPWILFGLTAGGVTNAPAITTPASAIELNFAEIRAGYAGTMEGTLFPPTRLKLWFSGASPNITTFQVSIRADGTVKTDGAFRAFTSALMNISAASFQGGTNTHGTELFFAPTAQAVLEEYEIVFDMVHGGTQYEIATIPMSGSSRLAAGLDAGSLTAEVGYKQVTVTGTSLPTGHAGMRVERAINSNYSDAELFNPLASGGTATITMPGLTSGQSYYVRGRVSYVTPNYQDVASNVHAAALLAGLEEPLSNNRYIHSGPLTVSPNPITTHRIPEVTTPAGDAKTIVFNDVYVDPQTDFLGTPSYKEENIVITNYRTVALPVTVTHTANASIKLSDGGTVLGASATITLAAATNATTPSTRTIVVRYEPQTAGAYTNDVRVTFSSTNPTEDNLVNTQIAISGNGVNPTWNLTSATLTMPLARIDGGTSAATPAVVGSFTSLPVSLRADTNGVPGDTNLATGPFSFGTGYTDTWNKASGGDIDSVVEFKPTAVGEQKVFLRMGGNDFNRFVSLSGTGVAVYTTIEGSIGYTPSVPAITGGSLDFGSAYKDRPVIIERQITLKNVFTETLNITLDGDGTYGYYNVSGVPSTLGAGEEADITVAFDFDGSYDQMTWEGKSFTIRANIAEGGLEQAMTVNLSCTPLDPRFSQTPTELDFNTRIFTQEIKEFKIKNEVSLGTYQIRVELEQAFSNEFTLMSLGTEILPSTVLNIGNSGEVDLQVRFWPRALRDDYEGAIIITHVSAGEGNPPEAPLFSNRINLTGRGVEDYLIVAPSALDFGTLYTGRTVSKTFSIQNTFDANATVTLSNLTGMFAYATGTQTGFTLAPNATRNVEVLYAPTVAGEHTAYITVDATVTDGPSVSYTVSLDGAAKASVFTVSEAGDFGDVAIGTTPEPRSSSVDISRTGTEPTNVTHAITGRDAMYFSLAPAANGENPILPGAAILLNQNTITRHIIFSQFWREGYPDFEAVLRFTSEDDPDYYIDIPLSATVVLPPLPPVAATNTLSPSGTVFLPSIFPEFSWTAPTVNPATDVLEYQIVQILKPGVISYEVPENLLVSMPVAADANSFRLEDYGMNELQYDTTYNWRVGSVNMTGSSFSGSTNFRTSLEPVIIPIVDAGTDLGEDNDPGSEFTHILSFGDIYSDVPNAASFNIFNPSQTGESRWVTVILNVAEQYRNRFNVILHTSGRGEYVIDEVELGAKMGLEIEAIFTPQAGDPTIEASLTVGTSRSPNTAFDHIMQINLDISGAPPMSPLFTVDKNTINDFAKYLYVDFEDVGYKIEDNFKITNEHDADIEYTIEYVGSGYFKNNLSSDVLVSPNVWVISNVAPASEIVVNLTFDPLLAGTYTGTFVITTEVGGKEQAAVVNITGVAYPQPFALIPDPYMINFGINEIHPTNPLLQYFTVQNLLDEAIEIRINRETTYARYSFYEVLARVGDQVTTATTPITGVLSIGANLSKEVQVRLTRNTALAKDTMADITIEQRVYTPIVENIKELPYYDFVFGRTFETKGEVVSSVVGPPSNPVLVKPISGNVAGNYPIFTWNLPGTNPATELVFEIYNINPLNEYDQVINLTDADRVIRVESLPSDATAYHYTGSALVWGETYWWGVWTRNSASTDWSKDIGSFTVMANPTRLVNYPSVINFLDTGVGFTNTRTIAFSQMSGISSALVKVEIVGEDGIFELESTTNDPDGYYVIDGAKNFVFTFEPIAVRNDYNAFVRVTQVLDNVNITPIEYGPHHALPLIAINARSIPDVFAFNVYELAYDFGQVSTELYDEYTLQIWNTTDAIIEIDVPVWKGGNHAGFTLDRTAAWYNANVKANGKIDLVPGEPLVDIVTFNPTATIAYNATYVVQMSGSTNAIEQQMFEINFAGQGVRPVFIIDKDNNGDLNIAMNDMTVGEPPQVKPFRLTLGSASNNEPVQVDITLLQYPEVFTLYQDYNEVTQTGTLLSNPVTIPNAPGGRMIYVKFDPVTVGEYELEVLVVEHLTDPGLVAYRDSAKKAVSALEPVALPQIALIAPAHNVIDQLVRPAFDWSYTGETTSLQILTIEYKLAGAVSWIDPPYVVLNRADFTAGMTWDNIKPYTHPTKELAYNTAYDWAIRVENVVAEVMSPIFTFSTGSDPGLIITDMAGETFEVVSDAGGDYLQGPSFGEVMSGFSKTEMFKIRNTSQTQERIVNLQMANAFLRPIIRFTSEGQIGETFTILPNQTRIFEITFYADIDVVGHLEHDIIIRLGGDAFGEPLRIFGRALNALYSVSEIKNIYKYEIDDPAVERFDITANHVSTPTDRLRFTIDHTNKDVFTVRGANDFPVNDVYTIISSNNPFAVDVIFNATVPGVYNTTVTITEFGAPSDRDPVVRTVSVQGTLYRDAFTVTPQIIEFGATYAGTPLYRPLTIQNHHNVSLYVNVTYPVSPNNMFTLGTMSGTTFTAVPNPQSVELPANSTSNFVVRFTSSSASAYMGNILITYDHESNPTNPNRPQLNFAGSVEVSGRTVTVPTEAPGAAVAVYPADDGTDIGLRPTFRWSNEGVATEVHFLLYEDGEAIYVLKPADVHHPNPDGPALGLDAKEVRIPFELKPEKLYSWEAWTVSPEVEPSHEPATRFHFTTRVAKINAFDFTNFIISEPEALIKEYAFDHGVVTTGSRDDQFINLPYADDRIIGQTISVETYGDYHMFEMMIGNKSINDSHLVPAVALPIRSIFRPTLEDNFEVTLYITYNLDPENDVDQWQTFTVLGSSFTLPLPAILMTPADDSIIANMNPTFTWALDPTGHQRDRIVFSIIEGDTRYWAILGADQTSVTLNSSTFAHLGFNIEHGKTYQWDVVTQRRIGPGADDFVPVITHNIVTGKFTFHTPKVFDHNLSLNASDEFVFPRVTLPIEGSQYQVFTVTNHVGMPINVRLDIWGGAVWTVERLHPNGTVEPLGHPTELTIVNSVNLRVTYTPVIPGANTLTMTATRIPLTATPQHSFTVTFKGEAIEQPTEMPPMAILTAPIGENVPIRPTFRWTYPEIEPGHEIEYIHLGLFERVGTAWVPIYHNTDIRYDERSHVLDRTKLVGREDLSYETEYTWTVWTGNNGAPENYNEAIWSTFTTKVEPTNWFAAVGLTPVFEFPRTNIGNISQRQFSVANISTEHPVTVGISLEGEGFTFYSSNLIGVLDPVLHVLTYNIPAGGNLNIVASFQPRDHILYDDAELTIMHIGRIGEGFEEGDRPQAPVVATLRGQGFMPANIIAVAPLNINYGVIELENEDHSWVREFTITNNANIPLPVTSINMTIEGKDAANFVIHDILVGEIEDSLELVVEFFDHDPRFNDPYTARVAVTYTSHDPGLASMTPIYVNLVAEIREHIMLPVASIEIISPRNNTIAPYPVQFEWNITGGYPTEIMLYTYDELFRVREVHTLNHIENLHGYVYGGYTWNQSVVWRLWARNRHNDEAGVWSDHYYTFKVEDQHLFTVFAHEIPELMEREVGYPIDYPFYVQSIVGVERELSITFVPTINPDVIGADFDEDIFKVKANDYMLGAGATRTFNLTFHPEEAVLYAADMLISGENINATGTYFTRRVTVVGRGTPDFEYNIPENLSFVASTYRTVTLDWTLDPLSKEFRGFDVRVETAMRHPETGIIVPGRYELVKTIMLNLDDLAALNKPGQPLKYTNLLNLITGVRTITVEYQVEELELEQQYFISVAGRYYDEALPLPATRPSPWTDRLIVNTREIPEMFTIEGIEDGIIDFAIVPKEQWGLHEFTVITGNMDDEIYEYDEDFSLVIVLANNPDRAFEIRPKSEDNTAPWLKAWSGEVEQDSEYVFEVKFAPDAADAIKHLGINKEDMIVYSFYEIGEIGNIPGHPTHENYLFYNLPGAYPYPDPYELIGRGIKPSPPTPAKVQLAHPGQFEDAIALRPEFRFNLVETTIHNMTSLTLYINHGQVDQQIISLGLDYEFNTATGFYEGKYLYGSEFAIEDIDDEDNPLIPYLDVETVYTWTVIASRFGYHSEYDVNTFTTSSKYAFTVVETLPNGNQKVHDAEKYVPGDLKLTFGAENNRIESNFESVSQSFFIQNLNARTLTVEIEIENVGVEQDPAQFEYAVETYLVGEDMVEVEVIFTPKNVDVDLTRTANLVIKNILAGMPNSYVPYSMEVALSGFAKTDVKYNPPKDLVVEAGYYAMEVSWEMPDKFVITPHNNPLLEVSTYNLLVGFNVYWGYVDEELEAIMEMREVTEAQKAAKEAAIREHFDLAGHVPYDADYEGMFIHNNLNPNSEYDYAYFVTAVYLPHRPEAEEVYKDLPYKFVPRTDFDADALNGTPLVIISVVHHPSDVMFEGHDFEFEYAYRGEGTGPIEIKIINHNYIVPDPEKDVFEGIIIKIALEDNEDNAFKIEEVIDVDAVAKWDPITNMAAVEDFIIMRLSFEPTATGPDYEYIKELTSLLVVEHIDSSLDHTFEASFELNGFGMEHQDLLPIPVGIIYPANHDIGVAWLPVFEWDVYEGAGENYGAIEWLEINLYLITNVMTEIGTKTIDRRDSDYQDSSYKLDIINDFKGQHDYWQDREELDYATRYMYTITSVNNFGRRYTDNIFFTTMTGPAFEFVVNTGTALLPVYTVIEEIDFGQWMPGVPTTREFFIRNIIEADITIEIDIASDAAIVFEVEEEEIENGEDPRGTYTESHIREIAEGEMVSVKVTFTPVDEIVYVAAFKVTHTAGTEDPEDPTPTFNMTLPVEGEGAIEKPAPLVLTYPVNMTNVELTPEFTWNLPRFGMGDYVRFMRLNVYYGNDITDYTIEDIAFTADFDPETDSYLLGGVEDHPFMLNFATEYIWEVVPYIQISDATAIYPYEEGKDVAVFSTVPYPKPVVLSAPVDEADALIRRPVFTWEFDELCSVSEDYVKGFNIYLYEVNSLGEPDPIPAHQNAALITAMTYTIPAVAELKIETTYMWKVIPVIEICTPVDPEFPTSGVISDEELLSTDHMEWTFSTVPYPGKVITPTPIDAVTTIVDFAPITFKWELSGVSNDLIAGFIWELLDSEGKSFATPITAEKANNVLEHTYVAPLAFNTQYTWQVTVKVVDGVEIKGDIWKFGTIEMPKTVVLVTPEDEAEDVVVRPTFTWKFDECEYTHHITSFVFVLSDAVGKEIDRFPVDLPTAPFVDITYVWRGDLLKYETEYAWKVIPVLTGDVAGIPSAEYTFSTIEEPAPVFALAPVDGIAYGELELGKPGLISDLVITGPSGTIVDIIVEALNEDDEYVPLEMIFTFAPPATKTIPTSGTLIVPITFVPTAVVEYVARVRVTNTPTDLHPISRSIAITGEGYTVPVGELVIDPFGSVDFGTVYTDVATSMSEQMFVLTNDSDHTIHITSIELEDYNVGFELEVLYVGAPIVEGDPYVLDEGEKLNVKVVFDPIMNGEFETKLLVDYIFDHKYYDVVENITVDLEGFGRPQPKYTIFSPVIDVIDLDAVTATSVVVTWTRPANEFDGIKWWEPRLLGYDIFMNGVMVASTTIPLDEDPPVVGYKESLLVPNLVPNTDYDVTIIARYLNQGEIPDIPVGTIIDSEPPSNVESFKTLRVFEINISPAKDDEEFVLDFGYVFVEDTMPGEFTITNNTDGLLSVQVNMKVNDRGAFEITQNGGPQGIPAFGSLTVVVEFTPEEVSLFNGEIGVFYQLGSYIYEPIVYLIGRGIEAIYDPPANLVVADKGWDFVELSWDAPFIDPAYVDVIHFSGYRVYMDDTLVDETTDTETTIIDLQQNTEYLFAVSAVYEIEDSEYETDAITILVTTDRNTDIVFVVEPLILDFEIVNIGKFRSLEFTIGNNLDEAIQVDIELDDEKRVFEIVQLHVTIPADGMVTIPVTFIPEDEVDYEATITITHDAIDLETPFSRTINVLGEGFIDVPLPVSLNTPAAAAINVSTTPILTWTLPLDGGTIAELEIYLSTDYDVVDKMTEPFIVIPAAASYTILPEDELEFDTVYFWRVVSVNAKGETAASPHRYFTTWAAPIMPPGEVVLIYPDGEKDVSLNPTFEWEPISGDITNLDIYISTNPDMMGVGTPVAVTATEYALLEALLPGTEYFWQVIARNFGELSVSEIASFTTLIPVEPPHAVTNLSPVMGASGVSLTPVFTWTLPTMGGSIDEIHFHFATTVADLDVVEILEHDATEFELDYTLEYDQTYFWRVVTVNSTGEALTQVYTFTTELAPVIEPPHAVTNLSPISGATDVSLTPTLSWTLPTTGGDIDEIHLYFSENVAMLGVPTVLAPDVEEQTFVEMLENYKTYYWQVVTINAGGAAPTAIHSFVTVPVPVIEPPHAVTELSPVSGATGISLTPTLSWTLPTTGGEIDEIHFYFSENVAMLGVPTILEPNVSERTLISALENGKTYYWRVDTVNEGGIAPTTIHSFTTTVAAPVAVTLTQPINNAVNVSRTPEFRWTLATAGGALDNVMVYLSTVQSELGDTGTLVATLTGTGTFWMPENPLNYGTQYFWRVDAVNASGTAQSTVHNFTVMVEPIIPPAPVVLQNPSINATGVSLTPTFSWTLNNDPLAGGPRTNIYLFVSTNDSELGEPIVLGPNVSSYVYEEALEYSTVYAWQVVAVNAGGVSSPNTIRYFTTMAEPIHVPGPVVLYTPADTATGVDVMPTFEWFIPSTVGEHTSLNFYMSHTPVNMGQPIAVLPPETNNYTLSAALGYDVTRYWQVIPMNGDVPAVNNQVFMFTTKTEPFAVSTTSLNFGTVQQTMVETRTFTIQNHYSSQLSVDINIAGNVAGVFGYSLLAIANGDGLRNAIHTIPANGVATVTVTFAPAANTTYNASVVIAHESFTRTVALTGTGTNPPDPLLPPTNLDYAVSANNVTLTWNTPTQVYPTLLGYEAYRGDILVMPQTNTLSTMIPNVPFGTHQFRVRAMYSHGASSFINTPSITIDPMNPPLNPEVSVSYQSITMTWSPPAQPASTLIGYHVLRNGVQLTSNPITAVTFTHSNNPFATYTFSVMAVYPNGNSEHANVHNVYIEDVKPVTNLRASVSYLDVRLDWEAPVPLGNSYIGYKVYRNDTLLNTITANTLTDANAPVGTHTYKVIVQYAGGDSQPATASAIVDEIKPAKNIELDVVMRDVIVEWEAPDQPGTTFKGYKIFRGNQLLITTTASTYTDKNVPVGTHEYSVVANYDAADSDAIKGSVIVDAINPPTNPNAAQSGRDVVVSWSAPIAVGTTFEHYKVYREELLLTTTTTTIFIDREVAAGTHTYHITAVYKAGESSAASAFVVVSEIIEPVFMTELRGNYPNPFNPTTTIEYSMQKAGNVSIEIYNVRGQKIKSLINTYVSEGEHSVIWDARDDNGREVGSGMYLYVMKTDDYSSVMRMTLMK